MKEKLLTAIAWRLPKALVYWCTIRLITHATTGEWGGQDPSKLSAIEALERWGVC